MALLGVANPLPASKLRFRIVARFFSGSALFVALAGNVSALDLNNAVIFRPPDQTHREKKATEVHRG